MPDAPVAGAVLAGRYRLDRRLGEGGMGVVWVARRLGDDRAVAVKVLKADPEDATARRRMVREARIAAALVHPNVVAVEEIVELEDGAPALVMELLEGESLSARLSREAVLPLADACSVLGAVVSAVGAAHAAGVMHRDLKPENVFLVGRTARASAVRVLDFGLAKRTGGADAAQASTALTETGALMGTPAYMAPEQVYGERDVDHRADVWALGIVMYRVLTGVLPTDGENVGQVLKKVLLQPIWPIAEVSPDVPAEVASVVGRMLERDRAQRLDDLREVHEALSRHAGGEAGPAFGPPQRASEIDAGARASALPEPPRSRPAGLEPAARARSVPRSGADETLPAPPASRAGAETLPAPPVSRAGAETLPAPPVSRAGSDASARVVTVSAPSRSRAGAARWARFGAGALVGATLLGGWIATSYRARSSPPAASSASTPPAEQTIVACPPLRASGVEEPAGWLGAAAAVTICARAQWMLGGSPERALTPAQLLDLPKEPTESFPDDPYADPSARDRALAAAKKRATLVLDGKVEWNEGAARLSLEVLDPTGLPRGRAEGKGAALYQAAREALEALASAGVLPVARALDPEVADLVGHADVRAAINVSDAVFAIFAEAGDIAPECDRARDATTAAGARADALIQACAAARGEKEPALALPDVDLSTPGRAIRTVVPRLQSTQPTDTAALAEGVASLRSRTTGPLARAMLAVLESWARQAALDTPRATELALVGEAGAPTMQLETLHPWGQLIQLADGTPQYAAAARAAQAWRPDNYYCWLAAPPAEPRAALALARRAAVVAPRKPAVAERLTTLHLASGEVMAARAIAARFREGGTPAQSAAAALLALRVDVAEGRVGQSFRRVLADVPALRGGGYVDSLRLELAWRALPLGLLLGESAALGDLAQAVLVAPEPPPLDGQWPATLPRLLALCAVASKPKARACFERLRELTRRGFISGASLDGMRAIDGAAAYAEGDPVAATRVWRALAGAPGLHTEALQHVMADAFDRAGEAGLAERIDAAGASSDTSIRGFRLGDVRAVRRALKRGDHATAAEKAAAIAAAWATLDEAVPALEEMRKVAAKKR